MRNRLEKYSEKEIQEAIKEGFSFKNVCEILTIDGNIGHSSRLIKQYVEEHNIDISHFTKCTLTNDDIFCKDSKVSQHALRIHYTKDNYSEYKCALCGINEWNGKPIVLNLDHIDGDKHNNELINLRWICPNCDSLLPTYCSNKTRKIFKCKKCNKEIDKNKTGFCLDCYKEEGYPQEKRILNITQKKKKECLICNKLINNKASLCAECYKKERLKKSAMISISRNELKELIRTKSFVEIGKEYCITDNAVRKYCKKYDLPFRVYEIKKYTDEEWEKL